MQEPPPSQPFHALTGFVLLHCSLNPTAADFPGVTVTLSAGSIDSSHAGAADRCCCTSLSTTDTPAGRGSLLLVLLPVEAAAPPPSVDPPEEVEGVEVEVETGAVLVVGGRKSAGGGSQVGPVTYRLAVLLSCAAASLVYEAVTVWTACGGIQAQEQHGAGVEAQDTLTLC
jgi:hypothetical protein